MAMTRQVEALPPWAATIRQVEALPPWAATIRRKAHVRLDRILVATPAVPPTFATRRKWRRYDPPTMGVSTMPGHQTSASRLSLPQ